MRMMDEIRAAIGAVEREVCLLERLERGAVTNGTALTGLRACWGSLLGLLEGGPGPAVRCRRCGALGEPGALHCWMCWEELISVRSVADAGHGEAAAH
jgi:hypothetical protein